MKKSIKESITFYRHCRKRTSANQEKINSTPRSKRNTQETKIWQKKIRNENFDVVELCNERVEKKVMKKTAQRKFETLVNMNANTIEKIEDL